MVADRVTERQWIDPQTGVKWYVAVTGSRFGGKPLGELRVSFASDRGRYHTFTDLGSGELRELTDADLTELLKAAVSE